MYCKDLPLGEHLVFSENSKRVCLCPELVHVLLKLVRLMGSHALFHAPPPHKSQLTYGKPLQFSSKKPLCDNLGISWRSHIKILAKADPA